MRSSTTVRHLGLLTLLVIGVFANTLVNKFALDDPELLLENRAVHGFSLTNLMQVLTEVPNQMEYLPVRDLSYMLDFHFWGLNPFGYHLANLAYYLIACWVLYGFLCLLLIEWETDSRRIALVATLLFALHPVHVEAVAGISQRKDVLAALFIFATFAAYLKGRISRKAYVLSLFLFALTMFSKATPVTAPLALAGLEILTSGEHGARWGRRLLRVIPFGVIAAASFGLNYLVMSRMDVVDNSGGGSAFAKVVSAFDAFGYYAGLLLVPYPLYINHPFFLKPFSILTVSAIALLALLLVTAIFCRNRKPTVSFAILWYCAFILPFLGMAASKGIVADRYLTIPSLGFCLLLAYLFVSLECVSKARIAGTCIIVLVLTSYGVLSFKRNFDWYDMVSLYRQAIRDTPVFPRNYWFVGVEYFKRGKYDEAFRYFDDARRLNPVYNIDYQFFRAMRACDEQRFSDAIAILNALPSSFRHDIMDVNMVYGKSYEGLGNRALAAAYYTRALESSQRLLYYFAPDARRALARLGNSR